ncbi:threonine synthase [Moorena producens PAL-8-15-08-1]|uniref:Threonine synthase n=1 Tax=Moorena producens PAL-8-15-08-1 TaxID=1458985 RepID=A0A1D8TZK0_9CYAN|nr:threonine synthase [Moorena producens]AOX03080.1 threonine synthase [Moorena producens PAL-8-15-08-1]
MSNFNHTNYAQNLKQVLGYKCLICGQEYQLHEIEYICPKHGNEGIVDVIYDYDFLRNKLTKHQLANCQEHNIWRYKPFLPIQPDAPTPPLLIGWTPIYHAQILGQKLGLPNLWIKDDGRNPTASFKDRASAIAIVKGQACHAEIITTASTGNAAASLAGLCASVGQRNVIFVPRTAPEAKIAQLLAYGSTVLLVDGTYDQAFELCLEAASEFGWYNRNTAYNPFMSEGKKTAALEICEQFNYNPPDKIFVSVGDGCIIGGLYKGFQDLQALGWIEKIPQLIGVQSKESAYLYEAWKNNESVLDKPPIKANTQADSIGVNLPRDRLKAIRAVTETKGKFLAVSDESLLAAIPALGSATGIFAEPAAAAVYAGLLEAVAQGLVSASQTILLIITGHGLKDISGAMKGIKKAGLNSKVIEPTLCAVKNHLNL